jgi:hypothetical protein
MEPQWKQFDNCEIYQYYIHDGLCADRKCACFLSPDRTFNESADVYTAHIVASQGHIEASHDATSTELGDVVSPRDGSSDIGAEGMQQNKYLQLSQGPVVDGSDSTLADDLNSLSIRCDGSPGHTEDGHHSAADMFISVPEVDSGIKLKAADYLNQPANSRSLTFLLQMLCM